MATETDFAALYRELGIDATCSLSELRSAWRRRVSKLHPDQGGSAEDTRRLQELNRLRDAAMRFHARHGRMPGTLVSAIPDAQTARAPPSPSAVASAAASTVEPTEAALSTLASTSDHSASMSPDPLPASGFGRISRYFTAVSLIAIVVLGWRVVHDDAPHDDMPHDVMLDGVMRQDGESRNDVIRSDHGRDTATGAAAFLQEANHGSRESHPATISDQTTPVKHTITLGMSKDTVRNILGEPLNMHTLRWTYGPSWVEFHCDKVAGWHSSPLRPLRGAPVREMHAEPAHNNDASHYGMYHDNDRCR